MLKNFHPQVIIGDRDQVQAALELALAQGRLARITEPLILSGTQVQLTAYLRAPAGRESQSRWARVRPWLIRAGKALAALVLLAAVAGLVWLTVLAVMSLIALVATVITWIHTHLVGLCVVAGVLLAVWIAGSIGVGGCGGLHCGGCRR